MIGHILVAAVIVIVVALVAFTAGMLVRRNADKELIEELEDELGARKEADMRMIAAAPPEQFLPPYAPEAIGQVLDDTRWDIPAVQLDGIEDLEIWTATLIASTDQLMVQLGINAA